MRRGQAEDRHLHQVHSDSDCGLLGGDCSEGAQFGLGCDGSPQLPTGESRGMPKKDKGDDSWFDRACEGLGVSLWWVTGILGVGVLGGYIVSRLQ
jgi:hypothetical protein